MKILRILTENNNEQLVCQTETGVYHRLNGDIFGQLQLGEKVPEPCNLLAPVMPPFVLCIGLNYRAHAAETGATPPEHPILFVKGANAVQHPGGNVEIPRFLESTKVDYEAELAVVIGKRCKNVSPEQALDHVLGYMCANDVSARDWQKHGGGGQWCRGKTFDTFAPLGPCLVTRDEIADPNCLDIQMRLNGAVVQNANTSDMIFSVAEIISFLSGSTTLLPGTVILTGTPSGVGMGATPPNWLQPGDEMEVEIEGIGTLRNPVVDEPLS